MTDLLKSDQFNFVFQQCMKDFMALGKQSRVGKLIFFGTLAASVFLIATRFIPVYKYAIVGAVFELLNLPALAAIFFLPIFSFLLWAGQKFTFPSIHLFSVLLALITILILNFIAF
jgi:hypothetical protein